MAFVSSSSFLYHFSTPLHHKGRCTLLPTISTTGRAFKVRMADSPAAGGSGKKPPRSRRFRPGNTAPVEKKKLEPETVFNETSPSKLELIVPTLSILTVIGIIPFIAAVARAIWVRYKVTSRRIAITSGFQGKDQVEIIYRDIASIKYIRRLGGAADCVISLKDGAKLEIRALPEFDKNFEYIMERVDEKAREASGPA